MLFSCSLPASVHLLFVFSSVLFREVSAQMNKKDVILLNFNLKPYLAFRKPIGIRSCVFGCIFSVV